LTHVDDVERQPGCGEEDNDGDEHPQQTCLGASNVGGGARLDGKVDDASTPHSNADQRVEDADTAERQQVTRQKDDADRERAEHPQPGPVSVTSDELVLTDDERSLPVDENPRREDHGRKQPDNADRTSCRKRRHLNRRRVEHL